MTAYIASMVIPDVWITGLHFDEVPLATIIMAALSCVLLLQQFSDPGDVSFGLLAGAVTLMLMVAVGYLRGNIETYSLKFFIADIYCFVGLLSGYAVARLRSKSNSIRIVSQVGIIATVAIIASYIGLFVGFLTPMFGSNSGRFVTASIFEASSVLLIILPLASVVQSGRLTGLMLLTVAASTFLSGTRSMLILTILTALVCLVLRPHRFDVPFLLRSVAGLAFTMAMYLFGVSQFNSDVFQRIATTQGRTESRLIELVLFWEQIANDLLVGQGMGSRFVSNVVVQGNPLASAPHIGIATFLMKGGVITLFAFVGVPLAVGLLVLFSSRRSYLRRGGAASVLVFIALACQSGGWDPLLLFCYGMAISVMTWQARQRVLRGLAGSRDASRQTSAVALPLVDV